MKPPMRKPETAANRKEKGREEWDKGGKDFAEPSCNGVLFATIIQAKCAVTLPPQSRRREAGKTMERFNKTRTDHRHPVDNLCRHIRHPFRCCHQMKEEPAHNDERHHRRRKQYHIPCRRTCRSALPRESRGTDVEYLYR